MTRGALPENANLPSASIQLPPMQHMNGETPNVIDYPAASSSTPAEFSPTFYRRPLPDTCVAFSSKLGRKYFASAMRNRGLKSYFHLMEQYTTQSEPAYCGISTLVISLNALAVDPRQIWKGPWRWYEESMLNCCIDLELAKETGTTLATFNCLALCQGLSTEVHYVDDASPDNSSSPSLEHFRSRVREACVETGDDDDTDTPVDRVLIVSYSRQTLKQTGLGHFSPVAAYDEESDTVLIMDTARFKYGAHWIKVPLLYEAMQPIDPDTGRSRGYTMLIHRSEEPEVDALMHCSPRLKTLPMAILLRSEIRQAEYRRKFKKYRDGLAADEVTYCNISQYFSSNGRSSIWDMISPQLRPYDNDNDAKEMVDELRALIRSLLTTVCGSHASSYCTMLNSAYCRAHVEVDDSTRCRENHCRTVPVRTDEAIFIVYLACLDEKEREAMVLQSDIKATDRARWQLLAEAELVGHAIDMSDQIHTTTVASSSKE